MKREVNSKQFDKQINWGNDFNVKSGDPHQEFTEERFCLPLLAAECLLLHGHSLISAFPRGLITTVVHPCT